MLLYLSLFNLSWFVARRVSGYLPLFIANVAWPLLYFRAHINLIWLTLNLVSNSTENGLTQYIQKRYIENIEYFSIWRGSIINSKRNECANCSFCLTADESTDHWWLSLLRQVRGIKNYLKADMNENLIYFARKECGAGVWINLC